MGISRLFHIFLGLCLLAAGPRLAAQEVTFTRDIAPILQEKCQKCHRPGQIAPMSFLNYDQTRPWIKSIAQAVSTGSMPPFFAAGPIGYYKNDIRLTDAERERILAWVNAGGPRGNPKDLPRPIEWDDSEWPVGEPDLILHFPRHTAPATDKDVIVTLFTEEVFPEQIWARLVTLRTTSRGDVHHASLFQISADKEIPQSLVSSEHFDPKGGALHTWFPGLIIEPVPEGQAFPLQKDFRIASRTHFAPGADVSNERMSVGIYYANGIIEKIEKEVGIQFTKEISIPPGASRYSLTGSKPFLEDAIVSHFRIHMHRRGKSATISFQYPDGTSKKVFDLPKYSFDWQQYYYLARSMPVPKGTVVHFEGVWNNDASNPENPDPTATVRWGRRTVDEMFGATVYYAPREKFERPLIVRNGKLVGRVEPSGDHGDG